MFSKGRSAGAALFAVAMTSAAGRAAAAPTRIGLFNGAADGAAGAAAAAELRRKLAAEKELSPIQPGDLSRALEDALPAESVADQAIAEASAQLATAAREMAAFQHTQARRALAGAEAALLAVTSEPRVTALLAEVTFQSGLVHLREQNRGLAIDAFRLVHRLSAAKPPLDPARYPPDVVKAFDAARKPAGATARLEVTSAFDGVSVLVDGAPVGATPLSVEIAAGPHYLGVAAEGYLSRGQRFDAAPGDVISLAFELERLSAAARILEARRRLLAAPARDRDTLRAAAREAAELASVDAIVIVSDGTGRLTAAVYQRAGDRLSVARPVDAKVGGLFGLLLPAPAPGPTDVLIEPVRPPEAPPPWYQRPWAVASMAGGAVLSIAVGVALATGGGEAGARTGRVVPPP